jgi:hypothetical protein
MRRQRVLQQRHYDSITEDDDALNVLLADHAIESLDDFLDVMEMEVIGAALVPGLRPPPHRVAQRFHAFDLFGLRDRPETETGARAPGSCRGRLTRSAGTDR